MNEMKNKKSVTFYIIDEAVENLFDSQSSSSKAKRNKTKKNSNE